MSQINPFVGSILQSTQAQLNQAEDKDRQVRKTQDLAKNAALADDRLEHQVESSEELAPVQKEERHERRFKRPRHHDHKDLPEDDTDEPPRLDVRA